MIRRQWPELSHAKRWAYIWYYFKAHIVVGIILLCFGIFFAADLMSDRPEEAFYVMVLEGEPDEATVTSMEAELDHWLGIDGTAAACCIETSLTNSSDVTESQATVSAYIQSGRVDLVIAPEERFNTYAATGCLKSLTDDEFAGVLDTVAQEHYFWAEQIEMEGAVTEIAFNPHAQTADSDCYGIYLTEGPFEGMVLGILVNCPHGELVLQGMTYFVHES